MLKGMMLGLIASALLIACGAGNFDRGAVTARPATKKAVAVASQERQTRSAPDNSTVTVETRNGARIETRVFNNPNSRISRIVRTTASDGKRTTRVYYRDGRVRELKQGDDENVLEETAEAIAGFADSALDVTATVARETAETATAVASTTADVATDVASATKQGAAATVERGREVASDVASTTARATETAAEATVDTAAAVGSKTAEAAEETSNFFVRGLKAVGRGFKRIFGF